MNRKAIKQLDLLINDSIYNHDFEELNSEDYIVAFKEKRIECNNNAKLSKINELNNRLYWMLDETIYNFYNIGELEKNRNYILSLINEKVQEINCNLFSSKEKEIIRTALLSIYNKNMILKELEKRIKENKEEVKKAFHLSIKTCFKKNGEEYESIGKRIWEIKCDSYNVFMIIESELNKLI